MPAILLPVEHFSQSDDGYCLPACAQMVLQYYGRRLSEQYFVDLFQATAPAGAIFSYGMRLERLGYRVTFGSLTEAELRSTLNRGIPLICRLWTVMLDHWMGEETPHVAVVVGYDERYVYLNDPAFPTAPQPVLWDGFLAAWVEYDQMAAIIQSTRS